MSPATLAFLGALLFFVLNFALGVGLQLGVRLRVRKLHHALYFLTCACTAVCVLFAEAAWFVPAALLGALLLMPRTRPGRWSHALLACLIATLFAVAAPRLL